MRNLHNALLLKQLYQLKQLGYQYSGITPSLIKEKPLELPHSLEELKKQATECHLCELSKSRQNLLFGEGNPRAKILFVGDTPTATQESAKSLFVGRAGEMLTNMIEKVLLIPRDEVYITNILKCHIPNNQPPTPTQAHTCLAYLQKEIEIIKPSLVVALGESAYRYLTGDNSSLESVRGILKTEENYKLIATFHPNYLLRNPSLKREAFMDMKTIKNLLETIV